MTRIGDRETLKSPARGSCKELFGILAILASLVTGSMAFAQEDIRVSADLDRSEVSADDTVSLKVSVVSEGGGFQVEDPTFQAPDFDVVNSFQASFVQSYYENGQFGSRATKTVTKVLRPKKTGTFKISDIKVMVNGKAFTAPALTVSVVAGGAGTPMPPGGGSGSPLAHEGQASGKSFYVGVEVNKSRIYKGEQLLVSYYLYRRVAVFNMEFTKFPKLEGFLKEDLENAGTGSQTPETTVVVAGVPFQKKLLVRYAAYPIKEGKLRIDPMAVKAYYQTARGGGAGDEDDPFVTMFRQFTPTVGSRESEPLTIDVLPLPLEGQTANFSGAVGDFSIGVSVDQSSVPANSPVTLTVTIQGRGNVSLIKDLKAQWPEGVDLYDSKGRSRGGQGGVNERVFEYLLIPRKEGSFTIPAFTLESFDPIAKKYVTKSTSPIVLSVGPGRPGSEPPPSPAQANSSSPKDKDASSVKVNLPEAGAFVRGAGLVALGLGALVFLTLGIRSLFRKWKARPSKPKRVGPEEIAHRLRGIGKGISKPEDLWRAYDQMTQALYDALDVTYGVTSRSYSRRELRDRLNLPGNVFGEWDRLFETAEMIRFSSQKSGAVSEADVAQLGSCLAKAGELIRGLSVRSEVKNVHFESNTKQ